MGAATDVRWLSPLALWTGILAGPMAWALDLTVSYRLGNWACITERAALLHLVTFVSLAGVAFGAIVSWQALRHSANEAPMDGSEPHQGAHFMAVLGLALCALFALTIMGAAIPRWILDACQ